MLYETVTQYGFDGSKASDKAAKMVGFEVQYIHLYTKITTVKRQVLRAQTVLLIL